MEEHKEQRGRSGGEQGNGTVKVTPEPQTTLASDWRLGGKARVFQWRPGIMIQLV